MLPKSLLPTTFLTENVYQPFGKWPPRHTQGFIHYPGRRFHWTTEVLEPEKKMWLLQYCNGPSSLRQWPWQGAPRSGIWAWSGARRKCPMVFQLLFLKTTMRIWFPTLPIWFTRCTADVQAGSQLKWKCGATTKDGTAIVPLHTSAGNGHFGNWHFLLSTFIMCNSNSDLFVVHFGPFTCLFYFKERLLGFFYSSVVYPVLSTALKRCMQFFDHMW